MLNKELKLKIYIIEEDKKYIRHYCKVQIKHNDLIRPKSIMCMLSKQYAAYEVMSYIKNDLSISEDKLYHGEADYIIKLPRGHVQLVNDLYFDRCYLHQLVLYHELNVPMERLKKYYIHHMNQIKDINSLDNLWVFYDCASHIAFHQALKHNSYIDIEKFCRDYVEEILSKNTEEPIREYLEILDLLIAKKTLVKTQVFKLRTFK